MDATPPPPLSNATTVAATATASASSSFPFQTLIQNLDYDAVRANLSRVQFDGAEFLHILTAPAFDEERGKRWVDDHFYLTLQISTLYVAVVFGTRYLMRNRPPMSLFVPLNAWNLFLAVFSIIGTIQLTPEFLHSVFHHGVQASYCRNFTFTSGRNGYWVWLFIVSKMFELVDTVFLVLRKRPLMFLHWYHHILTMIYAFYSYPLSPGFNRWGIYLNFFVHAFMYSYYFLRSMKIRVPGTVAKFITTIQIWQFIISVGVLIHLGYMIFAQKMQCDFDRRLFTSAVFMDVSYLILFVNFFLQAYVLRGGKAKYREKSSTNMGEVPEKAQHNGVPKSAAVGGNGHTTGRLKSESI